MIMIHVLVRLTNDQSQRQIFDVHKFAFNEFVVLEFKQTILDELAAGHKALATATITDQHLAFVCLRACTYVVSWT